jgi:hypothetical protein
MAWTTPLTAVSNATLTAAQWNASVRDDLLVTAPALATAAGNIFVSSGANVLSQRVPASDTINTSETTNNTSYTNLATNGPIATGVVSDIRVIVWWTVQSNTATVSTESISSIDVSGTAVVAPSDNYCTDVQQPSTGTAFLDVSVSRTVRLTVTAGNSSYKIVYRVTGGTGTFRRRSIVVLPF